MEENKTMEEWFLYLPPGYNERAQANFSNLNSEEVQKMKRKSSFSHLSHSLMSAFTWDSTPEGGDFWHAIYDAACNHPIDQLAKHLPPLPDT